MVSPPLMDSTISFSGPWLLLCAPAWAPSIRDFRVCRIYNNNLIRLPLSAARMNTSIGMWALYPWELSQLDALGRPAELALAPALAARKEAARELKALRAARGQYEEATAAYEELFRDALEQEAAALHQVLFWGERAALGFKALHVYKSWATRSCSKTRWSRKCDTTPGVCIRAFLCCRACFSIEGLFPVECTVCPGSMRLRWCCIRYEDSGISGLMGCLYVLYPPQVPPL